METRKTLNRGARNAFRIGYECTEKEGEEFQLSILQQIEEIAKALDEGDMDLDKCNEYYKQRDRLYSANSGFIAGRQARVLDGKTPNVEAALREYVEKNKKNEETMDKRDIKPSTHHSDKCVESKKKSFNPYDPNSVFPEIFEDKEFNGSYVRSAPRMEDQIVHRTYDRQYNRGGYDYTMNSDETKKKIIQHLWGTVTILGGFIAVRWL